MSRSKISSIILSFILLLQAAFFQIALPNLVLCFGEDGHISFEWQTDKVECSNENLINKYLFNNIEDEYERTCEEKCTDIDLHFHLSIAEKTQKKYHSLFSVKYFEQYNLWTTEKLNNYTTKNIYNIIPSNLKIEEVETTVLII